MPYFVVNTNVPKDDLPAEFVKELLTLVAKLSSKEEWNMVMEINPGKMMIRRATTDPCAHCMFYTFDHSLFEREVKEQIVADITTFLHEKLALETNRISFSFHPISSGAMAGINGKLFA